MTRQEQENVAHDAGGVDVDEALCVAHQFFQAELAECEITAAVADSSGSMWVAPPGALRKGQHDQDHSGGPNRHDKDRDGDGLLNKYDARPDNPSDATYG